MLPSADKNKKKILILFDEITSVLFLFYAYIFLEHFLKTNIRAVYECEMNSK